MPDGVALREPDGQVHVVTWSQVVGVERDGAGLTVFGSGGCRLPVDPDLFSGADAAVATVEANVPASLCYDRSRLIVDED